jgi:hypothetical protein
MDLLEELLPYARIYRRLFLVKQFVQSRVTVEVEIDASRGELIAGELRRSHPGRNFGRPRTRRYRTCPPLLQ